MSRGLVLVMVDVLLVSCWEGFGIRVLPRVCARTARVTSSAQSAPWSSPSTSAAMKTRLVTSHPAISSPTTLGSYRSVPSLCQSRVPSLPSCRAGVINAGANQGLAALAFLSDGRELHGPAHAHRTPLTSASWQALVLPLHLASDPWSLSPAALSLCSPARPLAGRAQVSAPEAASCLIRGSGRSTA